MTRRRFLGISAATAAAALIPEGIRGDIPKGPLKMQNSEFTLELKPGKGLECTLTHRASGTVLADGPYHYSIGTPAFEKLIEEDGTVTLVGSTDSGIEVLHTFRVQPQKPWIEEEIVIRNARTQLFKAEPRCGFTLSVKPETLKEYTFTAVPFRREPMGNREQYADYKLEHILHEKRMSVLRGKMNWHTTFVGGVHETSIDETTTPIPFDVHASEGWAISNGTNGFLVTKYNPLAMEWAILDALKGSSGGEISLCWGGAGIYCGDPEPACQLAPGASFRFGTMRLTAFDGDAAQGFRAFRDEMESRGHKTPNDFNPPLHWNELYDNKLWWLPNAQYNDPEKRKELYTLPDMEAEAGKARAIGCESLYMDPGWDVSFASKIWDESRLGAPADFVELIKSKYNLKVSLHTPLSGWCDPTSYPFECCRLDENGSRDRLSLCGASNQYVEETRRRLDLLGKAGVCYFMFDGSAYNGPCWDTEHGHPVPSGRHHHVQATNRIANLVHERYPALLIEMHDQMIGPRPARYVPIYFGYGKDATGRSTARGFDTIWAYELMWDPMRNLNQGNSVCLYYYNLAYSQPLYLHIDLRTDNSEAVMFWWNASTCRHLGIGGTHPDAAVRAVQKKAVGDYIRLKPHFTAGIFHGIDETTHVHQHPTVASAVINCFNIDTTPIDKKIEFDPARFGLPASKSYKFTGGEFKLNGGIYTATIHINAMGHQLIEIS